MSFFDWLLGRTEPSPREPERDVKALVAGLAQPAIHLRHSARSTRSHLGGTPSLPSGIAWPTHDGKRLEFLARLSLVELHATQRIDWLPASGALLFFYDTTCESWGFDPKDRGSWAVMLVDDAETQRRSSDDAAETPLQHVECVTIRTIPSWERPDVIALGLSNDEMETLDGLLEEPFGGQPKHQVVGFPAPVQSDEMELEAQLVSNGIYCGSPEGYADPRVEALRAGASDWRLLLQLDSDDALGYMWGDAGTLYFWVQESAARRGDFTNAWMILQCA